jgi:hypothetical protein
MFRKNIYKTQRKTGNFHMHFYPVKLFLKLSVWVEAVSMVLGEKLYTN